MSLIAGVAVMGLLFYLYQLWKGGKPQGQAREITSYGGYACLAGGAILLAMGRIAVGSVMLVAGLALVGRAGGTFRDLAGNLFGGRRSQIRAPMVEMTVDHRTGRLAGRFTAGRHAGNTLESLSVPQLAEEIGRLDPYSAELVEAYLDRRASGWRQNAQHDAGARRRSGAAGRDAMTEEEAYDVLGLQPGATEAQVRSAHRSLMKKLHPDHGGTDYLASRVNQAKDIILSKHR